MCKMGMILLLLCAVLPIVYCTKCDSLSEDADLKGSSDLQLTRDPETGHWDEDEFIDEENEENDNGMVNLMQQTGITVPLHTIAYRYLKPSPRFMGT